MNISLSKTESLIEFINTLAEYYDLKGNKPSKMILIMLATAIKTAVGIQDKQLIEQALKSMTLYDFLMTFANYYDTINNTLNPEHKRKMMEKIQNVINLTRVKKIK